MLDKFSTALLEISYSLGILSSRTCIYSFILIMHLFTHVLNNSRRGEKKRDCMLNRILIVLLDMELEKVTTFLLPLPCVTSLFSFLLYYFYFIEKKAQRRKLSCICYKYEIFRIESKPEEVKNFRDKSSSILGPFLDLLSTVFLHLSSHTTLILGPL